MKKLVVANSEISKEIAIWKSARTRKSNAEKAEREALEKIKALLSSNDEEMASMFENETLGDTVEVLNEIGETKWGMTWQKSNRQVDSNRLKADGLYEQYLKPVGTKVKYLG